MKIRCHCEEWSDEAISSTQHSPRKLLRFARNDGPSFSVWRCTGFIALLFHQLQEAINGAIADLATMFDSLLYCFTKMKPDEDA